MLTLLFYMRERFEWLRKKDMSRPRTTEMDSLGELYDTLYRILKQINKN